VVGWRFNNLRSILESDTPDNFRQLISLHPPPILRGGGDQNALEFLLLTTLYKTRGDVAANTAEGAGRESRSKRIERHPVDTLRQGTWSGSVPLGSRLAG
jgi:hypothetical protein